MSADDHVLQQVDKIDSRMIITVGVTALVIFALGIVWAIQIQRDAAGTIRSYTPDKVPAGDQVEIGMVFQQSFDNEIARSFLAAHQEHLDTVGWVDQKSKKVHIPIERAIKDYLVEAEKGGGKL